MPRLGTPGDLDYPDHLVIPGSATGTQDPVTGIWTPAGTVFPVYDGPVALQDTGATLVPDALGRLTQTWDAEAFLPPEADGVLGKIFPDQPCLLRWADGSSASAEIIKVRRFDGVVELRQLVPAA